MDMETINDFLDKKNIIGFIGATIDQEKWGYKKFKSIKNAGYMVYPINPKYENIDGDKCFSNLQSLIDFLDNKPDYVITIVPPKVTEKVVQSCIKFGINKIWMQPGSESEKAINLCKENNITVVHGVCIVVDAINRL